MLIVDAKTIAPWNRETFLEMRAGRLSAANVVCSIWEGFEASMKNVTQLKQCIRENHDLVYLVRSAEQLGRPDHAEKTGIILGWQNSSGFDDYLPFVETFAELGLRIVQIAFLTANSAGSGCNESTDRGLTDFGHDLIAELNRCGIAIDIAHLGVQTARSVVEASARPVFYAQSAPLALMNHVRNKSDADMRAVAERGGIIALAALPHYLGRGIDSTLDDFCTAVSYVINLVGEDSVAIGTDLTPRQPKSFYDYVSHDKGNGRRLIDYTTAPILPGLNCFTDYDNIIKTLERADCPASRIEKVMGTNLGRYFKDVWRG